MTRTIGDEFQSRIDIVHLASCVLRFHPVFGGNHVADLPWTVHFLCPNTSAQLCRAGRCRGCAAVHSTSFPSRRCSIRSELQLFRGVPVPRLSPMRGRAPTSLHQARNSSVPNCLVSIVFQALSRVPGRSFLARHHRASVAGDEIPSGISNDWNPSCRTSSATSLRNPFSSERLEAGS